MTRDEWRQVEPVLTQALVLPEPARDALLDTVRLEEAVRRDLQELLRRSVTAASQGVGAATLPGADVVRPTRFVPPALAGVTLTSGRYTVIRQIGQGGMGAVFLAHDTALGKLVALKLMPHDDRVLAEAQRAAICSDHPYVATLHNVLTEQIGEQTFGMLVMEYVAGTPASRLLEDGPIEIPKVVKWGRQVAAAVAHAHEHQILHCDLKPANIVVGPDGNAKVLDFGIARTTFETAGADEPLRGTLPYMAPEQLRAQEFTPAGDVYSLGVTLFELATGRRPFDNEGGLLRMRILAAPPPAVTDFVPAIPLELQRVLEQALEKDPGKRFRSARAFERALDGIEAGVRGRVDPPHPGSPSTAVWSTVGLGVVALIAGLALVAMVGAYTSAVYNQTLGRGGFANESVWEWLNSGFRASGGPFAITVVTMLAWSVARFAVRASARLLDAEGRWSARLSTAAARLSARPDAEYPGTRSVVALFVPVGALAAAIFLFRDLFPAFVAFAASSPPELLERLSPEYVGMHNAFQGTFTLVAILTVALWYPLLKTAEGRRAVSKGQLVGGALTLLVTLVLLNHPHRMLFSEQGGRGVETVRWQEHDCYALGVRGSDTLLLCPSMTPRRHAIVRTGDPAVVATGTRESPFRGFYRVAEQRRQQAQAR